MLYWKIKNYSVKSSPWQLQCRTTFVYTDSGVLKKYILPHNTVHNVLFFKVSPYLNYMVYCKQFFSVMVYKTTLKVQNTEIKFIK